VEYREEGVPRCRVQVTIPQHPFRSQWQPIEVDVVGYRLVDTIETAALEAIHIFYDQHSMEVAGYYIGLFLAIDSSDPEWNFRIPCTKASLQSHNSSPTFNSQNIKHYYKRFKLKYTYTNSV
jgi:hypothetical protein